MVVCKCRKATKLYCFVHKAPVCGECICFPEHQICVVRTYSEWVIDGEYDWPPTCCKCQTVLEAGNDTQTTRLGCLHIMHTSCLVSHIQSFPPHTAPAGYACPACSTSIWPPKSIKDYGSRLHSKIKEAIIQTGLGKNILGDNLVSLATSESHVPPAFASDPLVRASVTEGGNITNSSEHIKEPSVPSSAANISSSDIVELDGPTPLGNHFTYDHESNYKKSVSSPSPSTTTRKGAAHLDRQYSEISYYADDEDVTRKKYTRRGPLHHKFLRFLLPFWSSALPTLPVTAPPRKDGITTDGVSEGRLRRQKSSKMDPRKILLVIAIMTCMATMGILYYRLAQRSLGENRPEDELQ